MNLFLNVYERQPASTVVFHEPPQIYSANLLSLHGSEDQKALEWRGRISKVLNTPGWYVITHKLDLCWPFLFSLWDWRACARVVSWKTHHLFITQIKQRSRQQLSERLDRTSLRRTGRPQIIIQRLEKKTSDWRTTPPPPFQVFPLWLSAFHLETWSDVVILFIIARDLFGRGSKSISRSEHSREGEGVKVFRMSVVINFYYYFSRHYQKKVCSIRFLVFCSHRSDTVVQYSYKYKEFFITETDLHRWYLLLLLTWHRNVLGFRLNGSSCN